jgi:hypothetical protein
MAVRGTALLLVLLFLGGCGSNGTKERRQAVNDYFASVGKAQVVLVGRQAQINSTLQAFSLTGSTASELRKLRDGRAVVGRALRNVRGVQPPPDAERLQQMIVQRLELQRALLDELIATAVYIPQVAAIAPPLQAATLALRRNLGVAAGSPTVNSQSPALSDYAAAFGGYGDALKPISARLEALTAPPILRPSLDAERRALTRSIALCAAISRALDRRDIPAANTSIHALFSVSAELNGERTKEQQAAAGRAYNARVHRLDLLATRIDRERNRLVQVVG